MEWGWLNNKRFFIGENHDRRIGRSLAGGDLVVHKVFAGRNLDWGDVERVLTRQHGKLNLAQIRSELRPLLELKGELDAMEKLERMLSKVERRLNAKP